MTRIRNPRRDLVFCIRDCGARTTSRKAVCERCQKRDNCNCCSPPPPEYALFHEQRILRYQARAEQNLPLFEEAR